MFVYLFKKAVKSFPHLCYDVEYQERNCDILNDFSLTVKAATLIFISECGSAISSAKQGKSGFTYNLVKS